LLSIHPPDLTADRQFGDLANPRLTTAAHKPTVVIEQATSFYSFRFPELSQPI
jgi:hypothetical protein